MTSRNKSHANDSSSRRQQQHPAVSITPTTASFCYLDLDLDRHRSKWASGAAFVRATNARYGLSSRDVRLLGGSEVTRLPELQESDPEWKSHSTLFRPQWDCAGGAGGGGRIVLRLHWDTAPLACQNFATLCAHGSSSSSSCTSSSGKSTIPLGSSGKPLTYKNTRIHRVIQNFVVQGGDLVFGNGSGGESALGTPSFKDEKSGLLQKHNCRGLVGMGNSGKHSNTSQFYITFGPTPQCDGKHVLFGTIVSGWSVLDQLEQCASSVSEEPSVEIVVTDCGLWKPLTQPGSGLWFDQPDPESYTGISPIFMVRPRVAVVVPTRAVGDRFRTALGTRVCLETPHLLVCDSHGGGEASDGAGIPETVRNTLHQLLLDFAVDVILVAPACAASLRATGLDLPDCWTRTAAEWDNSEHPWTLEQVLLECKPAEAYRTILTRSWLKGTSWPFEGGGGSVGGG